MFGCETELNKDLTLGISKEKLGLFDFIIIPTTHFHMKGFTLTDEEAKDTSSRAKAWIKRLDHVLGMDLPFQKTGLAHLTCSLIAPTREEYLEVIGLLPDEELERLFTKAAELGVGIELNGDDMNFPSEEEDIILRPYKIAKKCGCKFYLGSDIHGHKKFAKIKPIFEKAIDLLGLTEDDKFRI